MAEEAFGPYRLVALLGRGGMGEVWRAVDTRKGREVAVKVLATWLGGDDDFARRFRRESALTACLRSPHIVPIHDYGEIDGRLFIEMPMLDGLDLGALVAAHGPLHPRRAVGIVVQIARALEVAHHARLLHRDVKPSNILVIAADGGGAEAADGDSERDGDGAIGHAYLIDFGIARPLDGSRISLSGAIIGTLAYMAPECFAGNGDERADIYALGCVLHETLTGQQAYPAASPLAYMHAHHNLPPPQPSKLRAGLPAGLDEVVACALAKDPQDRYSTAAALATAARAALTAPNPGRTRRNTYYVNQGLVTAPPTSGLIPPSRLRPRSRWISAAALLVVVAVAISMIWLLAPTEVAPGLPSGSGDPSQRSATATVSASPQRKAPTLSSTIGVGKQPNSVVISPDGRHAYVGSSPISVIDTVSNTVAATIPVDSPRHMALTRDGRSAYITANAGPTGRAGILSIIDCASNSVKGSVSIGGFLTGVAVAPDGRHLYVARQEPPSLVTVDLERGSVVKTVPLGADLAFSIGSYPDDVAVSPDGTQVWVTNSNGSLWVVTTSDYSVTTVLLDARIRIEAVAITPDGKRVLVTDHESSTLSVIDTNSRRVLARVSTPTGPSGVVVAPDGQLAYVADEYSGTVSVVDLNGGTVLSVVVVGLGPTAIAISPDGGRAYATNFGSDEVSIIATG